MSLVIEKGDNLFELIFELDRRLQTAQNHSSPSVNLAEAYKYLDSFLFAAKDKQPDVVDTVFLKLVDFFIKCNCNYKRLQLSGYLNHSNSNTWLSFVKSKSEALRRLCQLWDNSIIGDFETCAQILNFMSSCKILFFDKSAAFGLFFESFNNLNTVGGSVYGTGAVLTCSSFIQKLFDSLNENLKIGDEKKLEELILISKFVSSTLLTILNDKIIKEYQDETIQKELYRIYLICNIMEGNNNINLLQISDESISNLLIYF